MLSHRYISAGRDGRAHIIQAPISSTDVLVVGGGPAGSTVAALLAGKGLSVLLAERDHHPRFHIGESLLPMNMPILDRMGLSERVRQIGVKKLGADFPADNERGYSVFRFERCLNPTWPFAYQVRRDEFDQMLFANAIERGATALQGAKVGPVTLSADGATAEIVTGDVSRTHRARYVVDATGRDTLLGSQLRLKRRNPSHQSAALFAHFRGVERRPGEEAGNISICRFEHGWVWMIPLRDECVSVGAVCSPEYLKQRSVPKDEFLMQTLRDIPEVWKRMEHAQITGNLHATGNYSYTCNRISGPGWLMVGDAYAFIDPIFSTGVYLAMHSAELAADVVAEALRHPAREKSLQRRYERDVRKGIDSLSWFIVRFNTPAMTYLFRNPRNALRVEEAMISMLAGDVFRDGGVRWRLQFFKLLYFITSLGRLRASIASVLQRRRQVNTSFSGGTTRQDPA